MGTNLGGSLHVVEGSTPSKVTLLPGIKHKTLMIIGPLQIELNALLVASGVVA
jgi:hypothetical protein